MPDDFLIASGTFKLETRKLLRATNPRPVLNEAGSRKVSRMVRGMRKSGEPMPGGAPVSRRGALGFAGRFTYQVKGSGENVVLRYGNASRYAAQLAKPRTIRPVRAKFLTIPIAKEARGKRAADFPEAFFVRSGAGNLILAKTAQKGRGSKRHAELVPLFVLKKSVRPYPHPWGYKWDQKDERALLRSLRRRIAAEGES
jgi:hypothetical protein